MSVHIVCGLHRSGTTYVGKLLQQAGVTVVHEPLNERFGAEGVPIAYPYVSETALTYSELIDDILRFKRRWSRDPRWLRSGGFRKIVYRLSGGRSGIRWGWLRLRNLINAMPKHVCLKDPFASLATPYLVQRYGVKVVCMVRHPAAVHCSTRRQGWYFDVSNLKRQPALIRDYGMDIPENYWELAHRNHAASIALLWKIMFRVNFGVASSLGKLLMVSHERLCVQPESTVKDIFKHLEVPFIDSVELFLKRTTQADKVEAQRGRVHDFSRNSRALVDAWKRQIATDDLAIIEEIAGDEIQLWEKCCIHS